MAKNHKNVYEIIGDDPFNIKILKPHQLTLHTQNNYFTHRKNGNNSFKIRCF